MGSVSERPGGCQESASSGRAWYANKPSRAPTLARLIFETIAIFRSVSWPATSQNTHTRLRRLRQTSTWRALLGWLPQNSWDAGCPHLMFAAWNACWPCKTLKRGFLLFSELFTECPTRRCNFCSCARSILQLKHLRRLHTKAEVHLHELWGRDGTGARRQQT